LFFITEHLPVHLSGANGLHMPQTLEFGRSPIAVLVMEQAIVIMAAALLVLTKIFQKYWRQKVLNDLLQLVGPVAAHMHSQIRC